MLGMTGSSSLRTASASGERVVAIVNQRGRSKATGVPVDMRFAQVRSLRDGLAFRMQMYGSVEEALEAAGRPQ